MSLGTLDWATHRPATAIGKTFGYFDIPAFSFDSGWLGASVIVAQYNLSASRSFVFRNRPTKPTGVTYQLCVRFRIGSTVYRYALWTHDESTLVAPLYNGEVIKPNFCFELWSVSSSTNMSQATPIRIYTSLMQLVTDFTTTPADYADATAALNSDEYNQNQYPLPTTGLISQFKSDSGITTVGGFITAWADQVGAFNMAGTGSGVVFQAAGPNGYPWLAFGGAAAVSGTCPFTGINRGIIYMVARQRAWTFGNHLMDITNNALSPSFAIHQKDVTPGLKAVSNLTVSPQTDDMPLNEWHILTLYCSTLFGTVYLQVDDTPPVQVAAVTNNMEKWSFAVSDFAAILCYASADPPVPGGDENSVRNYLAARYALSYPLPAIFSDNSPWLDNT